MPSLAFENRTVPVAAGRSQWWQGRSGRLYHLVTQSLARFSMGADGVFLVAKGNHLLWAGSSTDLVGDPMSRTRFRLALDCADRVFQLVDAPADLAALWDIEGGHLSSPAVAA